MRATRRSKSVTKRNFDSGSANKIKGAPLRNRSGNGSFVDPVKEKRESKKQFQSKRAHDRLARLEKMYQELTQIENGANM